MLATPQNARPIARDTSRWAKRRGLYGRTRRAGATPDLQPWRRVRVHAVPVDTQPRALCAKIAGAQPETVYYRDDYPVKRARFLVTTDPFSIGRTIWPTIASVSSAGISDEAQAAIQNVLFEFAQYVADTLAERGLPRHVFPLFRSFNGLFGLTPTRLVCVVAPLSGGVASLRFYDWNQSLGEPTLEQLQREVESTLGWTDTYAFQLPAAALTQTTDSRSHLLKDQATIAAERTVSALQRQERRVVARPIFRTPLDDIQRDDHLCFVLMPFNPASDRLYSTVIAPVVEQLGLAPKRADQVFSPSPIVEDIWVHIASARLLIADVTHRNPNVFYELGLAHALGKSVIILAQAKEDIPFDIAYIRYFVYSDDDTGWGKLRADLTSAISAALATV